MGGVRPSVTIRIASVPAFASLTELFREAGRGSRQPCLCEESGLIAGTRLAAFHLPRKLFLSRPATLVFATPMTQSESAKDKAASADPAA